MVNLEYFDYKHLPEPLHAHSKKFHDFVMDITKEVDMNNPETQAGIRKMLEAKDCIVRARMSRQRADAKRKNG